MIATPGRVRESRSTHRAPTGLEPQCRGWVESVGSGQLQLMPVFCQPDDVQSQYFEFMPHTRKPQ